MLLAFPPIVRAVVRASKALAAWAGPISVLVRWGPLKKATPHCAVRIGKCGRLKRLRCFIGIESVEERQPLSEVFLGDAKNRVVIMRL